MVIDDGGEDRDLGSGEAFLYQEPARSEALPGEHLIEEIFCGCFIRTDGDALSGCETIEF